MLSLRQFHNALRILLNIDGHDVPWMTNDEWTAFSNDPYRFFIRCDDDTAEKLWGIIQARQGSR